MKYKLSDNKFKEKILNHKYSESRFVKVTDNWCGNYKGNTIELSISIFPVFNKKDEYIVSILASGNDNTYMALRCTDYSCKYAVHTYNTWKKYIYDKVPDGCNIEWFLEHGFLFD